MGGVALPHNWLESLGLSGRCEPELYLNRDAVNGARYAAAMRLAFNKLNLSAFFCVQDVPTVAFLVLDEYDSALIDEIHTALWNQGLASLLLVISGDRLRVYSLFRKPIEAHGQKEKNRRLLKVFELTADALELYDLITGVESGRLLNQYAKQLDRKERIDRVLLNNLMISHRRLCSQKLLPEQSQALLMQAMFIAYLEDREIIKENYFTEATGNARITSFRKLLGADQPGLLFQLFIHLKQDFNGDLFQSPRTFSEDRQPDNLSAEHVKTLAEFIQGNIELKKGQYRFWPYKFQFIPVELISTVYDRFLDETPELKRGQGAYYTPLFLADLAVDQAWEFLSARQRRSLTVLDPACGSGIFLVRLFEHLAPDTKSLPAIDDFSRFRTRHQRNDGRPKIELQHCLMPLKTDATDTLYS